MDGKIFNSDGQYVADIRANAIYDIAGKRLYHLRGQKIYKPTGELVGHLNSLGGDRRLNRSTDMIVLESRDPPACRDRVKGESEMTVPPNLLWTPEEEDELRLSILASKDIATIAKELNRTQTAIRRKASKLNLPLKVVKLGLNAKGK